MQIRDDSEEVLTGGTDQRETLVGSRDHLRILGSDSGSCGEVSPPATSAASDRGIDRDKGRRGGINGERTRDRQIGTTDREHEYNGSILKCSQDPYPWVCGHSVQYLGRKKVSLRRDIDN